MDSIRKYLWMIAVAIIIGEGILLKNKIRQYNNIETAWKIASANVKSYDELLSNSENKNTALQLTTDQLANVNDSLLKELDNTRKQLKIKSKNIKSEQYIASTFSKTDTILITDTIFRDKELKVDTIVGDEWYHTDVTMRYPSTVILKPTFKSEKHIIVSTKKETVNPPNKLWILRLFQKKHMVVDINVIEKNPYVEEQESRYIEIIK